MATRWNIKELSLGTTHETVFEPNPIQNTPWRFRATKLDGRRAPKPVLSSDRRIRAGVPIVVRLRSIHKPERQDRGFIEVDFVRATAFALKGVYIDPLVSKKLQILIENGLNILLDGPQGCGKTVAARAIAQALDMEFVFFNCSAIVEATDFLATITVRAHESGHPVTDFLPTDLLRAIEEAHQRPMRSFLVFLDEFNRCQEGARNALMPALDSTRRIFNPITNGFLSIPGNVQFVAAVNRGSEFSGTFGIDAAQLDRFAPVAMDYMPAIDEERLLHERHPTLGSPVISAIVSVAGALRTTSDLRQGLSVRATEEACVYLSHELMAGEPWKYLPEIFKSSFCGRYPGRWSDSASDAGVAWSVIQEALRKHRKNPSA